MIQDISRREEEGVDEEDVEMMRVAVGARTQNLCERTDSFSRMHWTPTSQNKLR